jgi:predicted DNA-binding mobile mystery protein A
MKKRFKDLRFRQLSEKLSRAAEMKSLEPPRGGWLRAIRTALEMPQDYVARRLGVSQAAVAKYEMGEKDGSIQLTSLRKAADAMDCDLVYALIPRGSLETIRWNRAKDVAKRTINAVAQTMKLEQQELPDAALEERVTELARTILADSPRIIWDL